MAVIGDQLTAPEEGWKRTDGHEAFLVMTGTWTKPATSAAYNGSFFEGNAIDIGMRFKFKGTKIRIISAANGASTNTGSSNIEISIDGVTEIFSCYSPTVMYQRLGYEKQGLTDGMHEVIITNKGTGKIWIDAFDTDLTGRVYHPDEVDDIKDLDVGKRIRANYAGKVGMVGLFMRLGKESGAFLAASGSTLSGGNGDFYFIAVDKDRLGRWKLIADRNVHNSITWDVLNSEGLATPTGIPVEFKDAVVPLSGYTGTNGEVIYSGYYSGYLPWKVFDKLTYANNNRWSITGTTGWIGYKFNNPKMLYGYSLLSSNTSYADWQTGMPKDWTFEGSNDGVNWTVLDTQTGQTDWPDRVEREYAIAEPQVFQQYRLNITANNGGSYVTIQEMRFFEKTLEDYKFDIRMLSGGTSTTDKDNDWDKYIVESNLGGRITPGDNSVWNWNAISSWTTTLGITSLGTRIDRGYSTVATYGTSRASSYSNAIVGFRPMLVVEHYVPVSKRYFVYDEGQYKRWDNDTQAWVNVSAETPTEEVFLSQGNEDFSVVPSSAWNTLTGDFDIVGYISSTDETATAITTQVPLDQTVTSQTGIPDIGSTVVTAAGANTRFAVSTDKQVWKVYNNGWQTINLNNLGTEGMTADTVNAIAQDDWESFGSLTYFAYYLDESSIIDNIKVQVPQFTTKTPQLRGVQLVFDELSIEGRLKDLEVINAINMMKLQFKANTLLQSSKYSLHEMVVDTFEEDSLTLLSGEAMYDELAKDYKGIGSLVTETEVLPSRSLLMISAEHVECTFEYSLDNGATWVAAELDEEMNIQGSQGAQLQIKITLPSDIASITAISYAWA